MQEHTCQVAESRFETASLHAAHEALRMGTPCPSWLQSLRVAEAANAALQHSADGLSPEHQAARPKAVSL